MGVPGATRCVASGRGTKNPGSNTNPPESGNEKTPLTGASSFRGEWGSPTLFEKSKYMLGKIEGAKYYMEQMYGLFVTYRSSLTLLQSVGLSARSSPLMG